MNNQTRKLAGILLACSTVLFLGCSEPLSLQQEGDDDRLISHAEWDAEQKILRVNGQASTAGTQVTLLETDSRQRLGKAQVSQNHQWTLRNQALTTPPCQVTAIAGRQTQTAAVSNSTAACGATKSNAQVNILGAALNDVALTALPPNAIMLEPAATGPEPIKIAAGDSLNFMGSGYDPAGNTPLSYRWVFDGARPNTTVQNPGNVTFSRPGAYRVKLFVSNSLGVPDPTPAEQLIVVQAGGNVINNTPPVAEILSPLADQVINVGDSLEFLATATHDGSAAPLAYLWDFGGLIPNLAVQNPGLIRFDRAGVFNIQLTVTDQTGQRNQNPAQVSVTVQDGGNVNQAPTGVIRSPVSDMTVQLGDSLIFEATGTDPDGNIPLSYSWNFGGAAPNSTLQNPGMIAFNQVGTFAIRLQAEDSLGLADPNPPMRIITVTDNEPNNSDFPDGSILTPDMDMTIDAGTTLEFTAEAMSPAGNAPLSYLWTFDGVAPDSMELNAGPVTFDMAGSYTVSFTVTDSLGQADPTPAERVITVVDPSMAPRGEIDSPRQDVTIKVGDTIVFEGEGDDDAGNHPLSYLWTFDGAAPDSMEQNPGPITFDSAGVYTVTLLVTDSLGTSDPTPPSVVITVEEPMPMAPDGHIDEPDRDLTINVGDSVFFEGEVHEIGAGLTPATFLWNFDGAAPDSTEKTPGPITFDMPGVYSVTLVITDAAGTADPVPEVRIITVEEPAAAPADPGPADQAPATSNGPNGSIVSPDAFQVFINVGDAINFLADGMDPSGNLLSFQWDFGGAAPNTWVQNPGLVTFNQTGVFVVTMNVKDPNGVQDPTPPQLIVNVAPLPAP